MRNIKREIEEQKEEVKKWEKTFEFESRKVLENEMMSDADKRKFQKSLVEKEKKFRIEQAMESGKPQEIAEKIVEGKMDETGTYAFSRRH